jgi:hypothetical protein
MGFSNHPPSGLFTNKLLHVSINNKIIFINRKEAYTFPNSSTNLQTINKVINNKISQTLLKTTIYLIWAANYNSDTFLNFEIQKSLSIRDIVLAVGSTPLIQIW